LIELSPKKTWEGYIGGGLTTMAFGFLLTALLSDWNFMRCPPPNLHMTVFSNVTCDVNPVFLPRDYRLPSAVTTLLATLFGKHVTSVVIRPVQFHSLAISAFASLIAPFGGFFASGVKRAFNIKDFGNSIPGHGGVTDRFDCQFIMAAFSHTYYVSFIRLSTVTVSSVFNSFLAMSAERQVELYQSIQEYLQTTGSISATDAPAAVAKELFGGDSDDADAMDMDVDGMLGMDAADGLGINGDDQPDTPAPEDAKDSAKDDATADKPAVFPEADTAESTVGDTKVAAAAPKAQIEMDDPPGALTVLERPARAPSVPVSPSLATCAT
ncbi:phosphatidate cytidylyltransferase, partial [Coemansia sp. RSA 2603]